MTRPRTAIYCPDRLLVAVTVAGLWLDPGEARDCVSKLDAALEVAMWHPLGREPGPARPGISYCPHRRAVRLGNAWLSPTRVQDVMTDIEKALEADEEPSAVLV